MSMGKIYGVGLGPGDPDLMSVRSDRLVRGAKHVAFFRKAGRKGQARQIVEGILSADAIEIPMEYPVTTEIPVEDPRYNEALSVFYEDCEKQLFAILSAGEDVIVLCEGDPQQCNKALADPSKGRPCSPSRRQSQQGSR